MKAGKNVSQRKQQIEEIDAERGRDLEEIAGELHNAISRALAIVAARMRSAEWPPSAVEASTTCADWSSKPKAPSARPMS